MINSDFPKINCPKCGHNDWYLKGRHRACRPCQALAARRYRARQALGQSVERTGRVPRPVSERLRAPRPLAACERAARTHCPRRHALSGLNVRWQADSLGRVQRVCRACHRDRQRARYGLAVPSSLAAQLADALDSLDEW